MRDAAASDRANLARRGLWLEYFTVLWNTVEAVVAVGSGILAGSIALVAFGLDSLIEIFAGGVLIWHLRNETRGTGHSERSERIAKFLVGVTFFLLAAYILLEAVSSLVQWEQPASSPAGIALTIASLIVMPALAWGKRKIAGQIGSSALRAESSETLVCAYLSFAVLLGLVANTVLGWWWADPVAALVVVYFVVREGWESVRGGEEGQDG